MSRDIIAIMPELMLIATAVVILLVDPLLPADGRRGLSWLGIFACITAALSTWFSRERIHRLQPWHRPRQVLGLLQDPAARRGGHGHADFEKHLFLKRRLLGRLLCADSLRDDRHDGHGRAIDLITFFVGLELMALSSYLLAGFFRYQEKSIEAAMKYFLTGAFASNFILMGMALLYGLSGSTNYKEIGDAVKLGPIPEGPLVIAIIFILAGFAFKVSAAPFHNWAPDVYKGSPTPAAAFLSVGPKVAAFAAILKFLRSCWAARAKPGCH